jgi:hypothetical protein
MNTVPKRTDTTQVGYYGQDIYIVSVISRTGPAIVSGTGAEMLKPKRMSPHRRAFLRYFKKTIMIKVAAGLAAEAVSLRTPEALASLMNWTT